MPTICPRCFKKIGETEWCRLCRDHNDPDIECYCPECQGYEPEDDITPEEEINAIAATAFAEAREQGQIVSGIYSYLVSLRDQLKAA